MESTVIATEEAMTAVGPHSQAVQRGNILAVGGQIGADPKSGILCQGFDEQIRQAMANLQAILKEAGSSFADVVMLRVYLTEEGHFRPMNTALEKFLSKPFPARTVVYVELPPHMLVEIDALAVVE
jgi:reactive intermediate/imine deaminase